MPPLPFREKSVRLLRNTIADMAATQSRLKVRGRRSEVLSMKLAFSHSLLEFMQTGRNETHKGRLRSYKFFQPNMSAPYSVFALIEETHNRDVAAFCSAMITKCLHFDEVPLFQFSRYRRFYVPSSTAPQVGD